MATCSASAQEWFQIDIPDGIQRIYPAGNSIEPNALVLWGTGASTSNPDNTITLIPNKFFISSNGGTNWIPFDSSSFSILDLQDKRVSTGPYSVKYVGKTIIRTTIETESPDKTSYSFEISQNQSPFSRRSFISKTGNDDQTPWLFISQQGDLFNVRFNRQDFIDSTAVSIYKYATIDQTWEIIPDEQNGTHFLPRPTSLTMRPGAPELMYIGTIFGVYRTGNGGVTWRPSFVTPAGTVLRVRFTKIHPRVQDLVYAAGKRNSEPTETLFRSTDGGFSWEEVFSDTLITSIALSWSNPSVALIATNSGLYASSNRGETWKDALYGLPKPYGLNRIQWIHIDPEQYARAYMSYADKMYVSYTWVTSNEEIPIATNTSFQVYPNPITLGQSLQIRFNSPIAKELQISVFDALGRRQSEQMNYRIQAGESIFSLPSNVFPNKRRGVYFLVVRNNNVTTTERFIIR